jgi:TnpA family transposase
MPVQLFSSADRERLSRYPNNTTHDDLIRYFTLNEDDLHVTLKQRGDANRLGFALHLCTLRYLGFLPTDLLEPPADILHYLVSQLSTTAAAFEQYSARPNTRSGHLMLVQAHLGYRKV